MLLCSNFHHFKIHFSLPKNTEDPIIILHHLKKNTQKVSKNMGALITLIDSTLFFYFLIIAIVAPILDAQTCLPHDIFPDFLINLKHWYSHEYGDYLVMEKPHFFVGLVWVEILLQWPLALINLYAIVSRKSWLNTTCLIYGVSCFTSMVAILAELMGSRKASDKLMMMYFPFMGLAVLSILRGLMSPSSKTTSTINKKLALGRKKRA